MNLTDILYHDMINAMKTHDDLKLSVIRMARTSITNKEKALRGVRFIEDSDVLTILINMVKQRQDSVEQFTKGNRLELAEKEKAEIEILESYLPKLMPRGDVITLVENVLDKTPNDNWKIGSIIKLCNEEAAKFNCRVDGKLLSELVNSAIRARNGVVR